MLESTEEYGVAGDLRRRIRAEVAKRFGNRKAHEVHGRLDIDELMGRVRREFGLVNRTKPAESIVNEFPFVLPAVSKQTVPPPPSAPLALEPLGAANFQSDVPISANRALRIDDFDKCFNQKFLELAYRTVLNRTPDEMGTNYYSDRLRSGVTKAEILAQLRFSKEGERLGVRFKGLRFRRLLGRAGQLPLVGYLIQIIVALWDLPKTQRDRRKFEAHIVELGERAQTRSHVIFQSIYKAVGDLKAALDQLTNYAGTKADHSQILAIQEQVQLVLESIKPLRAIKAELDQLSSHIATTAERSDVLILREQMQITQQAVGSLQAMKAELGRISSQVATRADRSDILALREQLKSTHKTVSSLQALRTDLDRLSSQIATTADRSDMLDLREQIDSMRKAVELLQVTKVELGQLSNQIATRADISDVLSIRSHMRDLQERINSLDSSMNTLEKTKIDDAQLKKTYSILVDELKGRAERDEFTRLRSDLELRLSEMLSLQVADHEQSVKHADLNSLCENIFRRIDTEYRRKGDEVSKDSVEQLEQALSESLTMAENPSETRGLKSALTSVTSRLIEQSSERIHQEVQNVSNSVSYLLGRVEFVRREMMYEMLYGGSVPPGGTDRVLTRPEVRSPEKLATARQTQLKLNLGCGHIQLEGYLNVDRRALPGVDIVAEVDDLPFKEGEVDEIFSAHLLEHFPQEQLRRVVLHHWIRLLKSGGQFRAVVPDAQSMIKGYADGSYPYASLREVTFGSQDYDGDFHFNMFVPDQLCKLLSDVGFQDIELVSQGRRNGECFEMELRAFKR